MEASGEHATSIAVTACQWTVRPEVFSSCVSRPNPLGALSTRAVLCDCSRRPHGLGVLQHRTGPTARDSSQESSPRKARPSCCREGREVKPPAQAQKNSVRAPVALALTRRAPHLRPQAFLFAHEDVPSYLDCCCMGVLVCSSSPFPFCSEIHLCLLLCSRSNMFFSMQSSRASCSCVSYPFILLLPCLAAQHFFDSYYSVFSFVAWTTCCVSLSPSPDHLKG